MTLETLLFSKLRPWLHAPVWHVAYSGGLDSTVLLHLLWRLSQQHALPSIQAVHVHHGLQAVAEQWLEHCQRCCDEWSIPLRIERVQVTQQASIERAAREARYQVFETLTGLNHLLLLGQHADDQAETLMLRLLRGSGVRGLAAMPERRPLGLGTLLRPLLGCTRAELEEYAQKHGLSWVEDPSNTDVRFARNYLRHQIMPRLQDRWPQTAQVISRAAQHLAEAQELLDELAAQDVAQAQTPSPFPWLACPSLDVQVLTSLSEARQRHALRYWLLDKVADLPDQAHWAGWQALRDAGREADPVWRLAGGTLRRGAGRIWWLADAEAYPGDTLEWADSRQSLHLSGNGRVYLSHAQAFEGLCVGYRQGGERLFCPGRGHRDLKRLLNELQVPVFLRARLPLLWQNGQLIAVANLPELCRLSQESVEFRWQWSASSVV